MEFKTFNEKIQQQFALMCQTGKLFRTDITGDVLWDAYLSAYPEEANPVFRDPESSSHNCNNCRNFMRRYGNIVAIDADGGLMTLFGGSGIGEPYLGIAKQLDGLIKSKPIKDVFFETFAELHSLPYETCKKSQDVFRLGVSRDHKRYTKEEAEKFGVVKPNEVRTFNHFHIDVPKQFVLFDGRSISAVMAFYRDKYSVFKRAMEEIPLDTLYLVRDLINQGSLLDGTAHLFVVERMITEKAIYDIASANQTIPMEDWCWDVTYSMDERIAKFKNTLIGVLCSDLAEGEELNIACKKWNIRVDPVNYSKATAPITQKQIAEAKKFVVENNYEASFNRRFAVIDDIKADEIRHINSGDGSIEEVSVFDNVKSTSTKHKRSKFDDIEEVSIEKFLNDILPGCTSVEAFLKNAHEGNLVTMTTAKDETCKQIFKWNNPYSWTFNGNLAGKSQLKDAVKTRGGKVDGVLRFSINWAEGEWAKDESDLDAWCKQPGGRNIGYSSKHDIVTKGQLDVDIMDPGDYSHKNIVENITWSDISKMPDGEYLFWVHQFAARNSKGFKAEIEFNGQVFEYEYNKPLGRKTKVNVAKVTKTGDSFEIEHLLPSTSFSKELWGLDTEEFHKVNLVCLSPNHWGDNNVGNKHYMFMLDKCKADTSIRGFHNENLLPDLLKHKKVMEVLGAINTIEPADKQLSGIGFNSTVKDELIVKCSGTFKRTLKIKF